MTHAAVRHIRTPDLDIAYEESGARGRRAGLSLHGWPYDPRCYDEVVPLLVAAGCRVIVPYLRGFGATRFLSPGHAALGPAGGARQRSARIDGCAVDRARRACRLRLGRPRRLHRRGAVAGTRARPRHRQRLQHPGHRRVGEAGCARAGASLLVPVLFPHRTRPRRPRAEPPRLLPAALAIMVAALDVRRRHFRAQRRRRSTIPISSP